jgi:hypothetical protein
MYDVVIHIVAEIYKTMVMTMYVHPTLSCRSEAASTWFHYAIIFAYDEVEDCMLILRSCPP